MFYVIILVAVVLGPASSAVPGALVALVGMQAQPVDTCCDEEPADQNPQGQDDRHDCDAGCHRGCCSIKVTSGRTAWEVLGIVEAGPLTSPVLASHSCERRDSLLRPPQFLV